MLKAVRKTKRAKAGGRFAVIASMYNGRYVDAMLRAAVQTLRRAGVGAVEVVRVPGAFEIPVVAGHLARRADPEVTAILCLGVILRGETAHAQLIAEGLTQALAVAQTQFGVPIIHEVLLLENERQAVARCLDRRHNRGAEAAETALAMAEAMKKLP